MMLSSSTRASLAVALVLLCPALARAQQPAPAAVPAGEPPTPQQQAQEQAVITNQAQQAYIAAHQADFRRSAALQVEADRREAWEQRGRDNIPPQVIVRPPALSLGVQGRLGVGGDNELQIGLTPSLDLRMNRWWGLSLSGGVVSLRSNEGTYVANSRLAAGVTEASVYVTFLGQPEGTNRFISPTHGTIRVGHQLFFPIGQPSLPAAYLGLFAGVGAVFTLGPIDGGKGWIGLGYDVQLGYRFGLGSKAGAPLTGVFGDVTLGPVVGF